MPNGITATGIQTKSQAELLSDLTTAFQAIYGADINLNSNTPDGQALNIFIQAILDNLDLIVQVYNSFDPDLAFGATLDERVAINGIKRQGGTFTLTNITLTVDRALNLAGLDGAIDNPNGTGYTVADNANNQYILAASQMIATPGTYVFQFRAKNPGAVLTVPNTITSPVTVVIGVTSINNPTTYTSLGANEESDAVLKIRRQKSVSLGSQGYLAGLLAALENINGVTAAFVYENVTDTIDADSIPGHSIWVIVNGGAPADIAQAIYTKRNAGCGMKGSQTFAVTQLDGSTFIVKWDNVVPQNLFIQFDVTSLDGIHTPNPTYIANQLVLLFTPGVFQEVNINGLATLVQQIDPNALVTNAGFSLASGGPYTNTLTPSAKNNQFAISAGNIFITVV